MATSASTAASWTLLQQAEGQGDPGLWFSSATDRLHDLTRVTEFSEPQFPHL